MKVESFVGFKFFQMFGGLGDLDAKFFGVIWVI